MVGAENPPASLYVGSLRHRRFTPLAHAFRYPIFMVLLDIDRIDDAMRVSWLTSYNRWNWASFMDRDHLGDAAQPLRRRVRQAAADAGIDLPDGRILLLTHLRYLGYCFNPISFYYCFDRADRLVHVLAEVHNTFGGAHNYWLAAPSSDSPATVFRAVSAKALYVSPFLEGDLTYGFTLTRPGPQLIAHIDVFRGDETPPAPVRTKAIDATLTLTEQPWTAAALRRVLARYPWMTAAVIARIHWQAVRLWWKGVAVVPRPSRRGEFATRDPERTGHAAGSAHVTAR